MIIPDISHWETVTSWAEVKKNCPFIIFKGTQRLDYVDPKAFSFIDKCEEYRIPYWIYVYLNKGNEYEQAKFLVKTFNKSVSELNYFCGYCLDAEEGNSDAEVLKSLKYLEALGKNKVMLYTMHSQMKTLESSIAYAIRKNKIGWWEARYGLNSGKYNKLYPPHSGVTLHQYTDKGKLSFIKTGIDLNRITEEGDLSWFTETVAMRKLKG